MKGFFFLRLLVFKILNFPDIHLLFSVPGHTRWRHITCIVTHFKMKEGTAKDGSLGLHGLIIGKEVAFRESRRR